jgi:hypothetical protein
LVFMSVFALPKPLCASFASHSSLHLWPEATTDLLSVTIF